MTVKISNTFFLTPKNICFAKIFGKKEQSHLRLTVYHRKRLNFMRIATQLRVRRLIQGYCDGRCTYHTRASKSARFERITTQIR